MYDVLISRLVNCRSIAASRLPNDDVTTIDDVIAELVRLTKVAEDQPHHE